MLWSGMFHFSMAEAFGPKEGVHLVSAPGYWSAYHLVACGRFNFNGLRPLPSFHLWAIFLRTKRKR